MKGLLWYEIEGTGYALLAIVKVLYYRGPTEESELRNKIGVVIEPIYKIRGQKTVKEMYQAYKNRLIYCDGAYHTAASNNVPPNGLKVAYNITAAGDAKVKIIIEGPPLPRSPSLVSSSSSSDSSSSSPPYHRLRS